MTRCITILSASRYQKVPQTRWRVSSAEVNLGIRTRKQALSHPRAAASDFECGLVSVRAACVVTASSHAVSCNARESTCR